jgi:hypothetical protein
MKFNIVFCLDGQCGQRDHATLEEAVKHAENCHGALPYAEMQTIRKGPTYRLYRTRDDLNTRNYYCKIESDGT